MGDKYFICDAKVLSIDLSDKYLIGLIQCIVSSDLSDKDMIADKYFICDIFFIGDILY